VLGWFSDVRVKAQSISLAILDAQTALKGSRRAPLSDLWSSIKQRSADDAMVQMVLQAVPIEAINKGVSSLDELRSTFRTMEAAAREGSLLSESSHPNNVWANASARFFSWFLLRQHGNVTGMEDEAILARAKLHVDTGDVRVALAELARLSPLARQRSERWAEQARQRVLVEQTLLAAQAHIAVLTAQLS